MHTSVFFCTVEFPGSEHWFRDAFDQSGILFKDVVQAFELSNSDPSSFDSIVLFNSSVVGAALTTIGQAGFSTGFYSLFEMAQIRLGLVLGTEQKIDGVDIAFIRSLTMLPDAFYFQASLIKSPIAKS